MTSEGRRRRVASFALLCAAFASLAGCGDGTRVTAEGGTSEAALPPLSRAGRWWVDAAGRVVMLRGVNMVEKAAPYYPAAYGFGEDDVAFLASEGFNVLRLGVDFRGLMPTPGVVEEGYIDHLAETVEELTRHQMFTLIDFHQDGFSPMFNGNGLPDWMAISDGLPNPPDAVFPVYYVQNPAMQRAFEHFWANSPGPGGIGLQDYFIQGLERVVARFADNPMVLGTELFNEPWPGADWTSCGMAAGCPDIEEQRLMPFYRKAGDAARRIAPQQLVLVEPFVLFNFGSAPTSVPGADTGNVLAIHSYALSIDAEIAVLNHGFEAAERDQVPLLLSEFGATENAAVLNRLTAEFEERLAPWIFWAYNENIIADRSQPATPNNVKSEAALNALVRPYPIAIAGTPTRIAFDPASKVFELEYQTVGPGGARYGEAAVSSVFVPVRHYADGYGVTVEGATVVSSPGASPLLLRNEPGVDAVSLRLSP